MLTFLLQEFLLQLRIPCQQETQISVCCPACHTTAAGVAVALAAQTTRAAQNVSMSALIIQCHDASAYHPKVTHS
eukprot:scaffold78668_cov20-Tisochrysis_lutea.AAC.1